MSEPRLNEALKRLRHRAAAAAVPDEGKNVASESFRAFLRQSIIEEIHGSGLEGIDDLRSRIVELERKVDELIQIIGALESEPPSPVSTPAGGGFVPPEPPAREGSRSLKVSPGWFQRGRGRGIIAVLIVAIVLAAAGLILTATGLMPSAVTNPLNQIARSLGNPEASAP